MHLEEYVTYDAVGLGQLVKKGDITAQELTDLALSAAGKVNPAINAIVEIFDAPVVDPQAARDGIFFGVPCFKKDIGAAIAGYKQECGSRLLAGVQSPATDFFSTLMLRSGLQILGRTTTSEFGESITTESLAQGITRNPWNTDFIVGGSSGGSAALVAAGVVPIAHTNDGGGSTRIPASICGNIGLKTSRGLVSHAPNCNELMVPMLSDLCNSRSVRDTAAFLDAVAKPGVGDATYKGMERNFSYLEQLKNAPAKFRIGISTESWCSTPMDAAIKSEVERVATLLADLGHHVEEFTPPMVGSGRYWSHVETIIFFFTFMQIDWLTNMLKRQPSFDTLETITLQIYEAGAKITAKQHAQAWAYANFAGRTFAEYFQTYDLLMTPTLNRATPRVGSDLASSTSLDLKSWSALTQGFVPFTPMANLIGIPAISVPVGICPEGLPLGMHFMGAMGTESKLLDIAQQLEVAVGWSKKRPHTQLKMNT